MSSGKKANNLAHESSPYLRQHMYNPVNWYAWGHEAWETARQQNKLVLISIGYSACHWCHVMEHNCFENEKLASIMNEHFINIKVDREERPDIDNIYMDAVQIMTGRGGWPLNCFALPDKRPVYGGTYFPPEHWEQVLLSLVDVFKNQPEKVYEYAQKLEQGMTESGRGIIPPLEYDELTTQTQRAVNVWKAYFDNEFGGPRKEPKFPLPCNYIFLLRYAHLQNDIETLAHVEFTLDQMAYGGIYDHVGGGFARYSVDAQWHVPHFEKMLYDNAQLISLYSEAYARWKKPLYKKVIEQTIDFVNREMRSEKGCYYSALDADTNGEEGDFYVWNSNEIKSILKAEEWHVFSEKFGIDTYSLWEHGKNVLRMRGAVPANEKIINQSLQKLFNYREQRVRPGLDDKVLTSWNALMVSALCNAAVSLQNDDYKQQALHAWKALQLKNKDNNGNWIHCRQSQQKTVNWLADDAALLAQACLHLYNCFFDEDFIIEAKRIYDAARHDFFDESTHMFFYSPVTSADVLIRKHEMYDNVIPSSNAVWAGVLYRLGTLLGNSDIMLLGEQMTKRTAATAVQAPMAMGQWLLNQLDLLNQHQVAVTGENAPELVAEFHSYYLPHILFAAGNNSKTSIALLESRLIKGQSLIYVCRHNTCNLPLSTTSQALKELGVNE